MMDRHAVRWIAQLPLAFALTACSLGSQVSGAEADLVRSIERERLRSLVAVDIATAERLHADDFQLINPAGAPLTKREYLDSLSAGQLDYVNWEAGEIAVRLSGDIAVIRYRDAVFEVARDGNVVHRGPMYHTNVYEKRGGRWQIVWSQASGIIAAPR